MSRWYSRGYEESGERWYIASCFVCFYFIFKGCLRLDNILLICLNRDETSRRHSLDYRAEHAVFQKIAKTSPNFQTHTHTHTHVPKVCKNKTWFSDTHTLTHTFQKFAKTSPNFQTHTHSHTHIPKVCKNKPQFSDTH